MGRLADRVAIVTGSGRGIGRATALRFAEEGAAVVINDLDPEPAQEVAEEIKKNGGQAISVGANIMELPEAQKVVQAAIDEWGKLDILVNNAGTTKDKTFHNMGPDIFDFGVKVNLYTAYNMAYASMPFMREAAKKEKTEQGAASYHRKIVFTSSVAAITGNAGQANYTAAKGGLISMTKTLARELGQFQINVNAVAPGFVETRLTQAKQEGSDLGIPDQMRAMALMMISIGRYGRPEDIANVHLFLASQDSDFVSGVTIPVTGGQIGGM
ncbi:MAG TPA: glucose 1-dehydrogenase [Actinomycetota bacterium]|nr:glucose 1-dehydrogenase [Actinomycetota bacterium]